MSKRKIKVEPEEEHSHEEPPAKAKLVSVDTKRHIGPATTETNVLYAITIVCIRCSHITSILLNSSELPVWAREFLLSIRWDKPNEPFTEADRNVNWDKDKAASKRSLQLQALCEPNTWPVYDDSKKKGKTNKCVRDAVLESLREQYPDETIETGVLYRLNMAKTEESMGQVVTQYGNLISAEPRFIAANTVISTGRISIMEHWRDEIA